MSIPRPRATSHSAVGITPLNTPARCPAPQKSSAKSTCCQGQAHRFAFTQPLKCLKSCLLEVDVLVPHEEQHAEHEELSRGSSQIYTTHEEEPGQTTLP